MKPFHPISILTLCAVCLALAGCPGRGPVAGETRTFDGIPFQWCPPGTFAMGSPVTETPRGTDETLHQVTLSKGFWLSTYEITQAQWEEVVGNNPSGFVGEDLAVEQVTWNAAQDFLVLLNLSTSGDPYRLPTEAEWEYACRAGTTTRFYWGHDANFEEIDDYAWWDGNSTGGPYPVGEKGPNDWGLCDMSGSSWEWCQDWYGAYPPTPVTDPQGPASGTLRVARGGGWLSGADQCRSPQRGAFEPTAVSVHYSFRLLRTQE